MVNAKRREMMGKLYRLVEQYEKPFSTEYADEAVEYFRKLITALADFCGEYPDDVFATEFAIALCNAVDKQFKDATTFPLKEKEVEQQQNFL